MADASADVFAWTQVWAHERGLAYVAVDETGSTNTDAKNAAFSATDRQSPTVYLARRQTQGRGRGQHTWTTPPGSSLLSSWSFALEQLPQPIFSALVGLALFESCQSVWPTLDFNLKAPNDLFIAHLKTAGILIESIDQGRDKRTVIGLGVNVTAAPEGLNTATCIGAQVTRPEWWRFLDTWFANLKIALADGARYQLSTATAERLRTALNRHPLLSEPILKVDELGQLHSASKTVFWHEL